MAGTAKGTLFSLKDFAIKLPTDVEWTDVDWVIEATYKGSHQTLDLYGDDALKDTLNFNQKGEITVKATRQAMAVLEKVTGSTATTSGGYDILPIHAARELNPPILAVRATGRFIKDDGTEADGYVYFFRTKCATTFEGLLTLANGKQCELILTFTCFDSSVDENGDALSENSYGRIEWPTG